MTNKNWIKNKIEEGLSKKDIAILYPQFKKEQGSSMGLSSFKRRILEAFEEIEIDELEDVAISNESLTEKVVKLSAQKQKLADLKKS